MNYQCSTIDSIALWLFCGNKLIMKFKWEHKEYRIAKMILKKTRRVTQLGFKTYSKATVIMTVWN